MARFSFFGFGRGTAPASPMAESFSSCDVPGSPCAPSEPDLEPAVTRRLRQFDQALGAAVVDLDRIRDISWAGIPDGRRPSIWRLFLDYEPVNRSLREQTLSHKRLDYFDCLERVFGESHRYLWTVIPLRMM